MPLPPPPTLGPREAAQWCAIVDAVGSDHFLYAMRPLLAAYCGVIVQLDDINAAMTALVA